METLDEEKKDERREILCGQCPDEICQGEIYYLSSQKIIRCPKCGQKHGQEQIYNVIEIENASYKNTLTQMLKTASHPERRFDLVKVLGLSNYDCKLISPLLTTYGMDRTGRAKLLSELGHGKDIDCGKVLGNRSFSVSPKHLNIEGYGRDKSGSVEYLKPFLDLVRKANNNEERLIPIHVDGDGHCLVHAISRALIGRELFWHGLRVNLQQHIRQHKEKYVLMFKDFHEKEEWDSIIEEASPYGSDVLTLGLGNIHIFALCNVLKRPILLIDTLETINNAGDYTALFVPAFTEPGECNNKSPLCIAWSNGGYNHFVPLVAVMGLDPPKIPRSCLPKIWGVEQGLGERYLEFNEDGSLVVARGKILKDSYLQRLVNSITVKFEEKHLVSLPLVSEYYRYVRCSEYLIVQPRDMINETAASVFQNRLFICLDCKALQKVFIPEESLCKGGELYNIVVESHQYPKPNKEYSFPYENVRCCYDKAQDKLVLSSCVCNYCKAYTMRAVTYNGQPMYKNGDVTSTRTTTLTACRCGKKHYWDGREYDNTPHCFVIHVQHDFQAKAVQVTWFYGETETELNSDANKIANDIIATYFPNATDKVGLKKNIKSLITEKVNSGHSVGDAALNLSNKHSIVENTVTVKTKSTSGDRKEQKISELEKVDFRTEDSEILEVADQKVDSKIRIKIFVENQIPITEDITPGVTLKQIQSIIFVKFNIEEKQQILKHGFPPKLLQNNKDGVLGLKNGDQIKVSVKTESTESLHPVGKFSSKNNKPFQNFTDANEALKHALQHVKQVQIEKGYPSMWEYTLTRPELFLPGGVFYEQFKHDIGLKHRSHCRLPDFDGKTFQYNAEKDRIELCLEPLAGHYPINEQVQSIYDMYYKGSEDPAFSKFKAFNSAPGPGFRILNKTPMSLSEKEKQEQKEMLTNMIKSLRKPDS